MSGRLYVVSTPIGNLGDLSQRAIETLRSVGAILAEDTRHSRNLLQHFGIETKLQPYHEHNEARATPRAIARLKDGVDLALISDAGTPLLSDPGARLVRSAIEAGIQIIAIPGASALLTALVVSGLDAERFTFFGFLPRSGRDRTLALEVLCKLSHAAVVYEAPPRVASTLSELARIGAGERKAVVARELTKQFEEVRRGTVGELAAYYEGSSPRGEVVIVLSGATPEAVDENAARESARRLLRGGLTARDVVKQLVADHGVSRNTAYRLAHEP
ncbi:MAG: 16S rRNA (cytidine(1402)-2'-O)-methyltransferase [Gemmatimonadaceae bacterium]